MSAPKTTGEAVEVVARTGTHEGVRVGEVVYWHWSVDEGCVHRLFLMLDHGVQLHRPIRSPNNLWPEWQAGWWYVDLVHVEDDGDRITVHDRWLDLIVPPDAYEPYRILDLDEFGEAVAAGRITVEEAAADLARLQRFLDTRVQGLGRRHAGDWHDFPPTPIRPYLDD